MMTAKKLSNDISIEVNIVISRKKMYALMKLAVCNDRNESERKTCKLTVCNLFGGVILNHRAGLGRSTTVLF